jgi:hypothetical protein
VVDPDSDKVSRASPYSGTAPWSLHHFAYGAFTRSGRPSQNRSTMLKISYSTGYPRAALQPQLLAGLGSSDFARRYFRNLILISVPEVLRWFSSLSMASAAYVFSGRMTDSHPPGYPIRLSGDHRICAPPPGFSQLITAFFASRLLGIHHKPVFA